MWARLFLIPLQRGETSRYLASWQEPVAKATTSYLRQVKVSIQPKAIPWFAFARVLRRLVCAAQPN